MRLTERTPTGEYICRLCVPSHCERFLLRRALWEQHGFKEMIERSNEHIVGQTWGYMQVFGNGGVRLATTGKPEVIIARIRGDGGLVQAFPITVRPCPPGNNRISGVATLETNSFCDLFFGKKIVSMEIRDLVNWVDATPRCRLLRAPIQRTIVWTNEQVIHYWDSLLRGYPAGMMMVHRLRRGEPGDSSKGRNAEGITRDANEDDFLLFDGQQRMAAILLGLGKGDMTGSKKLWIDLGKKPNGTAGLRFELRMTSSGQPFGYRIEAPNQKIELKKRREAWDKWKTKHGPKATPEEAFRDATGTDLIDAKCAVPLSDVYHLLHKTAQGTNDIDATIKELSKRHGAPENLVKEFVSALEKALQSKVILQQVDVEIICNQEEYIRFFQRLGQGGTRLSDDELTYSIIKYRVPEIHDRMKEIMKSDAGRLAGEVDLVMAGLRAAKIITPSARWPGAKDWELINRPDPAFVHKLLHDRNLEGVKRNFFEIIPRQKQSGLLEEALKYIRNALSYDNATHPKGLPAMLLARLPRELVDVLVLVGIKWKDQRSIEECREALRPFVLHWLLFVGNNAKAAWRAFEYAKTQNTRDLLDLPKLVEQYEKEGIARFMPRQSHLGSLREHVEKGDDHLRSWAERFTAADGESEHKPGEALRVLSTNDELVKRSLMWLQRQYIAEKFPDYDPTSDRDDDLPIDLDHLIPYDIFGFHWSQCEKRLVNVKEENFRWQRSVVGNSLGNYRWLRAKDNRERKNGKIIPLENGWDLIQDLEDWNRIIPENTESKKWSTKEVATFQRLIDCRTIDLYNKLLTESGISQVSIPRQSRGLYDCWPLKGA